MSQATAATATAEVPLFLDASGESLFAVWTRPTAEPNGVGVVITQSAGRNRVMVRLARRLAARGFHVIRFDFHGRGESTGVVKARLNDPFAEDVTAAVGHLEDQGVDRHVLVGKCFGARTALAASPQIGDVMGVVCVATSVLEEMKRLWAVPDRPGFRYFLGRALRASTWKGLFDRDRRAVYGRFMRRRIRRLLGRRPPKSERDAPVVGSDVDKEVVSDAVLAQLQQLTERRVPVLFLFGNNDEFLHEWERAQTGPLGEVVASSDGLIQVDAHIEGRLHDHTSIAAQDAMVDQTERWISALV